MVSASGRIGVCHAGRLSLQAPSSAVDSHSVLNFGPNPRQHRRLDRCATAMRIG